MNSNADKGKPMFSKMKPETIARRAKERVQQVAERKRILRRRLAVKAKAEGPDSIWAEMLAELDNR